MSDVQLQYRTPSGRGATGVVGLILFLMRRVSDPLTAGSMNQWARERVGAAAPQLGSIVPLRGGDALPYRPSSLRFGNSGNVVDDAGCSSPVFV